MMATIDVDSFLAFARRQPPRKRYDYYDIKGCALCQYFIDAGIGFTNVAERTWTDAAGLPHPIPQVIADGLVAETFGQLVEGIEARVSA
jgi:hypothetical protein